MSAHDGCCAKKALNEKESWSRSKRKAEERLAAFEKMSLDPGDLVLIWHGGQKMAVTIRDFDHDGYASTFIPGFRVAPDDIIEVEKNHS